LNDPVRIREQIDAARVQAIKQALPASDPDS
jgi:hypothetical protein